MPAGDSTNAGTTISWAGTRSRTEHATVSGTYLSTSRRRAPTRGTTARPRTSASTMASLDHQRIICAISESRGVSPTVGIAFVNLDTWEAVLSQICDSQTYARTIHKLFVYGPTEVLFSVTATKPRSKLLSIVEENLEKYDLSLAALERGYYSETEGLQYIQQLAYTMDVEAIKVSVSGKYFALCAFAAALKHIEVGMKLSFPYHSLRIKYEPPEGSMMIDISTVSSLELVQNLHDPKSKDCLYGHLKHTLTPMGARLLKSNILQPLTNPETINIRLDAVEELTKKEELFFGVRSLLKEFIIDVDRILSSMLVIIRDPNLGTIESSINNVISLRQFVEAVPPLFDVLSSVESTLLQEIRKLCAAPFIGPVRALIETVINEDVRYSKSPLDLRNQRTFAVRAGVNGLLDVSRQAYEENSDDALEYVTQLHDRLGLKFELKFDNIRQYYLRIARVELEDRTLPSEFVNVVKVKDKVECSTMELLKLNQRIVESHNECLAMSDETVNTLVENIRKHAGSLFKISESVAMLDMISAFANLATMQEHVRPILQDTYSVQSGRHPVKEEIQRTKFIPNDIRATKHTRMQIITGCNMSGKSTYIRTIALLSIMAQIGAFLPAEHAAIPIRHQLFARISVDDSIEGNISTFATEMQEMAFILRNVDKKSLIIVDELGRGTNTRDGLAIAIAVCEALIDSEAFVWFVTHFTDLATIMAERIGVTTMHLAVEIPDPDTTRMTYNLTQGPTPTEHYGISMACMVPLPADIVPRATEVAKYLEDQKSRRSMNSTAMITQKRRRLILSLKDQLEQAYKSDMQVDELRNWLEKLRRDFVSQMSKLGDGGAGNVGTTDPRTVGDRGQGLSNLRANDPQVQKGDNKERAIVIEDDIADLLTENWSSSDY